MDGQMNGLTDAYKQANKQADRQTDRQAGRRRMKETAVTSFRQLCTQNNNYGSRSPTHCKQIAAEELNAVQERIRLREYIASVPSSNM